jgi:hypothetical protein
MHLYFFLCLLDVAFTTESGGNCVLTKISLLIQVPPTSNMSTMSFLVTGLYVQKAMGLVPGETGEALVCRMRNEADSCVWHCKINDMFLCREFVVGFADAKRVRHPAQCGGPMLVDHTDRCFRCRDCSHAFLAWLSFDH